MEPQEAARFYGGINGRLIVLSYGWLSKEHPDPYGFHLCRVLQFIKLQTARFDYFDCGDLGLFWDFASLPQPKGGVDRTPEEKRVFGKGLKAINLLYGSPTTSVIQLKGMPEVAFDGMNATEYDNRGWCVFEEVTGGILKRHDMLLNLDLVKTELNQQSFSFSDFDKIKGKASGTPRPPMHPDDLAVELETKKFTSGADRGFVAEKYRQFIEELAPGTSKLQLEHNNITARYYWGPEEIRTLARALPLFISLEELKLDFHPMGDEGATALAQVLPMLPKLKKVSVFDCDLSWEKGRQTLIEVRTRCEGLFIHGLDENIMDYRREGPVQIGPITIPAGPPKSSPDRTFRDKQLAQLIPGAPVTPA